MNELYRTGLEISKLLLTPLLKISDRALERAERARDSAEESKDHYLIKLAREKCFKKMLIRDTYWGKLNRIEEELQNAS